jgi:Transcriptional regulator/sugar kinase
MEAEHRIVVQLEHTVCTIGCVNCRPPVKILESIQFIPDLSDPTGRQIFQQIEAEVRKLAFRRLRQEPDAKTLPVDVVMPGSLKDRHTIIRVSRLNIHKQCNLDEILGKNKAEPYNLTNDVFASSLGQLDHFISKGLAEQWSTKTILFVYIDEGVGSLILHKGRMIRGAGFAGPFGHTIVEPVGQYFDDFRARGCLEAYCSRPSMSSNIVNRYFTDREKNPTIVKVDENHCSDAFARALSTIDLKDKETLTYELMNEGIQSRDPLALLALNEATDYLGLAISHIIVALNPHLIILDGEMIHKIEGFFDQTFSKTRQYTWVDAWNSTVMIPSIDNNLSAVYGVICAARDNRSFYDD